MGRNIHLILSWTRNLYGKNEVSAEIIVWYAMDSNKKKLLDRIADIRMIHEMSSAQNALDHLKDHCSNSWTTRARVQCRLFNRVLKRWIAQLISVILFSWIVIYPVDSAIQLGGGGELPYKRLMGMCRWMGSHFDDWIDYSRVAFSIEFTRMGWHIFGFWGWESCSYLRLANVPEYLSPPCVQRLNNRGQSFTAML